MSSWKKSQLKTLTSFDFNSKRNHNQTEEKYKEAIVAVATLAPIL